MEFPRLVYKCPGPHSRQGGTYDYAVVNNEGEHAAQLEAGWFNSMPEAIEGKAVQVDEPAQEEDPAPTRAELEEKAKELGIAFDGRTSDAKLLAKITEELA